MFTLVYCIVYIFIIFIMSSIWKGIFMCVKGKKDTNSGLIIRNNSKSILLKVLAWPLAGSPKLWATQQISHFRKTPWLSGPPAHSSHTQARPGRSWFRRRLLQPPGLAFAPSPRPRGYLCKQGRALCKHCHSLCDHQAFHTHLLQVGVNKTIVCSTLLIFEIAQSFWLSCFF